MPKHEDYKKIYANFVSRYGKEKGERLYYAWLNKKKLDDTKPYPSKSVEDEIKIFSFNNCQVCKNWEENNKRFVKVIVSGILEDRDGERMSREAGDKIISALKTGTLPVFPNHGKTEHGGMLFRWQDILGKWVDGEWSGNDIEGIMQLNRANPEADKLWSYIQEKMPVGFSLAGKVKQKHEEDINLE